MPDITANDIQTMINQRQEKSKETIEIKSERKESDNKKTDEPLCKPENKILPMVIDTSQKNSEKTGAVTETEKTQPKTVLSCLLNQSNQLYLIENLSAQGINDPSLILKTAEQIIAEYA